MEGASLGIRPSRCWPPWEPGLGTSWGVGWESVSGGSSWSSGACGASESDWGELFSGHPPISVYLPIHPPVPFSPSASLSICSSICHLSVPGPLPPLLQAAPLGTSFSSPVIWAVITGLALALTLHSPGSQYSFLSTGGQAQSASTSPHGRLEVLAQTWCSLTSPSANDAQMPALFPEGPPVPHCTRLLSTRQGMQTVLLCSAF